MDWEIVASVVMALVLFTLAVGAVGMTLFALMARGMKKQIEGGAIPKCRPLRSHM